MTNSSKLRSPRYRAKMIAAGAIRLPRPTLAGVEIPLDKPNKWEFLRGKTVRVPKGTPVKRIGKGTAPAGRDVVVKVHHTMPARMIEVAWVHIEYSVTVDTHSMHIDLRDANVIARALGIDAGVFWRRVFDSQREYKGGWLDVLTAAEIAQLAASGHLVANLGRHNDHSGRAVAQVYFCTDLTAVCWAGSGGYWAECPAALVTVVEPTKASTAA